MDKAGQGGPLEGTFELNDRNVTRSSLCGGYLSKTSMSLISYNIPIVLTPLNSNQLAPHVWMIKSRWGALVKSFLMSLDTKSVVSDNCKAKQIFFLRWWLSRRNTLRDRNYDNFLMSIPFSWQRRARCISKKSYCDSRKVFRYLRVWEKR